MSPSPSSGRRQSASPGSTRCKPINRLAGSSVPSPAEDPPVRPYAPGDEAAIQQLFVDTFGWQRSLDEWRWRFLRAPDGPAQILVLEHNGRLIGHTAHVPFSIWIDGRRCRLGHGGDTMIAAAWRGRGGMKALVERFLASSHDFDLRINFPTDQAAKLMERYGGGRLLGRLPKWVRLFDRPPRASRVARLAPGSVLRAYGSIAARPAPRVAVEPLDEPGARVDELAHRSADVARCIRVRDAAYLRWRWLEQPGERWRLAAARASGGALCGFAVWGRDRHDASGRRGLIADLLAIDAESTRALLIDAAAALRAQGCAVVVFECTDPRPWARRALLRAGFLPAGGDINVVAGSLSPIAGFTPEDLGSWYLTRGDTDLA